MLDIVKEFMLEDKLKDIELIDIMKEHIQFLQSVIKGKERKTECLIERIPLYYHRNVNTQANCDSQSCVETSCEMSCDTSNIESTPSTNKESITHNPKETFVLEYTKWHLVGDKNKKRKKHIKRPVTISNDEDVSTTNRYEILDECCDFENQFGNNVEINHLTNREISALRKQPTKEKTPNKSNTTHYPKRVPGNSTYSRISN